MAVISGLFARRGVSVVCLTIVFSVTEDCATPQISYMVDNGIDWSVSYTSVAFMTVRA